MNLFYGFLSGSDELPDQFNGKEVTTKLQKPNMRLSVEIDLTNRLSLNVEGYYKDFNQLENINRDKIYEDDAQHSEKPDYLKQGLHY